VDEVVGQVGGDGERGRRTLQGLLGPLVAEDIVDDGHVQAGRVPCLGQFGRLAAHVGRPVERVGDRARPGPARGHHRRRAHDRRERLGEHAILGDAVLE